MTGASRRTEQPKALPPDARAWLAAILGHDEIIDVVRALPGATSSDVFGVTIRPGTASRRRLILRWYSADASSDRDQHAVVREAAALGTLAGTGVPAPALVAVLDGGVAGASGVLMTQLPGRPRFDLPDPGAIKDVLEAIHAVDPGPMAEFPYRGYHEGVRLERPSWWRDRLAWERAVRQTSTARPSGPDRLIHRDFHPGNLLWDDDRLGGVVDWVNTCAGPAAVDAAHCRVNLALLFDPERADELVPGDPAWDIELALGMLDWQEGANDRWPGTIPSALAAMGAPLIDTPTARTRLEGFVRRALASLA